MAKAGGQGRGAKPRVRKTPVHKSRTSALPIGRPPRLAHLVPGTDRQHKRERALQVSMEAGPTGVSARSRNPTQPAGDLPPADVAKNTLCLPHPEWLPHVLTVSGPASDVSAFRRAAAGPGVIPWARGL